ncbi:MAG: glycosyltransferase [Anaerolineae bacterium]|nr:glycosyltransferase [Anaerolineae bacterium]MCB9141591.1 glycosyltransferase [Anaerolineales bacterium]
MPPILFFTPDPPTALWQDKPQIARRLARRFTVVMAGPELHLPSLRSQHRAGHWRMADLRTAPLTRLEDNLYRFTWSPLTAATGAPILGDWTASARRKRWQSALRQLAAAISASTDHRSLITDHRPILWLFRPGMLHFVDEFNPQLVIYHVVDEYSAYPGLSDEQRTLQRNLDRRLTERADLVFCTARSLVEERQAINPNTHYMPNAVDFRAFQRELASADATPLDELPRPVLGVVGGINAKLDLELLAPVARQRPDWTLALVGPVSYGVSDADLASLRSLPNVHFTGPVAHEQVPAVIGECDVCLIPYRLNEQTRHVNPLKVYEYLAGGKPVVATPLPELAQFGNTVRLAGDAAGFIAAVEASLPETADPLAQATRRAVAAANTWDLRVARMIELVDSALRAAPQTPPNDAW